MSLGDVVDVGPEPVVVARAWGADAELGEDPGDRAVEAEAVVVGDVDRGPVRVLRRDVAERAVAALEDRAEPIVRGRGR